MRVVIVGAGLAGLRAAEVLRDEGYSGETVLLGAEPEVPYTRPPLSKQILAGAWEVDRAALRSSDELEELALDLRIDSAAVALDLQERSVRLSDGTTVDFDGLIIATGAKARWLPDFEGRPRVHTLRTLADTRILMKDVEEADSILVVGGGFIGAEVAATCRTLGKTVSIVEPQETLLVRGLGPEIGSVIEELHRSNGVDVRVSTSITGVNDDGNRTTITLDDGSTVSPDVIVLGVGATPDTQWLEGSDLHLDDGVVCDRFCRVLATDGNAVPSVVAAGDVARWWSASQETNVRVEHWTNAQEQARSATRTLLADLGEISEEPTAYDPVPYVWSDQYGKKIQVVGYVRGSDVPRVVKQNPDSGAFLALMERDGVYVGAVAMAMVPALVHARMLLEQRSDLESARAVFTE